MKAKDVRNFLDVAGITFMSSRRNYYYTLSHAI